MDIVHDPFGIGDPYHPAPTERMPHRPIAGETTTVGFATAPAGAAQRAWATWRTGDKSDHTVEAEHVNDTDDASYWRAQLPGLRQGDKVQYRLCAQDAECQFSTQAFSFVVLGWETIGDVQQVRALDDRLVLTCGRSHLRWVHIALIFSSKDALRIEIRRGAEDHSEHGAEDTTFRVIETGDDAVVAANDRITVRIHRHPLRLDVLDSSGNPLLVSTEQGVCLLTDGGEHIYQIAVTFMSPQDESLFGFGERFNALNQRGNSLDVRVYEEYKNQGKRTYIPVPFFISSRGYGLFLDTSRPVTYDLATTHADRWSFVSDTNPGGDDTLLNGYLFVGTPKQILGAFTSFTAKPALPPPWAFGPWMSGNEWNSQAIVMQQVQQTRHHDIPATVLVIEAWSDEATFYIWNDARYEPQAPGQPFRYRDFAFSPDGKWPDPRGMIDFLHSRGIHLLLWQVPVMKRMETPHAQHRRDEAYMIEQGYCVREADGSPYRVRPFWFRGGLVLDVTNPAAKRWWLSKRAYLLDEMGIDGFKTDGGEHLWGDDLVFANGKTGAEMVNLYPTLYAGAYYDFAQEKRGAAITFSRAGFTGCQAFPCHWAGDENSTWEAFRASILAGLNAGASGIPFWGWDIAGFSGEIPSAELYLRSTAMACFCPIMQYHSEFNEHRLPSRDRTPWNIQERTGDPDVIPIFRQYAQLRMKLLPYIYAQARKASETGIPLMRALPIEYPGDSTLYRFPFQYMFGDELLVAPVVEEGTTEQRVYLPQGEWADFWTTARHIGPVTLNYPTPKNMIPVFARKSSTASPLTLSTLMTEENSAR